MSPRAIVQRTLAVLALTACDLEDELEGQPCTVAEDCWHTQECARTTQEEELGLSGVCMPEGTGCVRGAQLGCGCVVDDFEANCSFSAAPPVVEYPVMTCDAALAICVERKEEAP